MLIATLCVTIPPCKTLHHPTNNVHKPESQIPSAEKPNDNAKRNPCPQKFAIKVFRNILYVDVECDRSKSLHVTYRGYECVQMQAHLLDKESGERTNYYSGCQLHCIDDCEGETNKQRKTTNKQRKTTNKQRKTTKKQRKTTNKQTRTTNKQTKTTNKQTRPSRFSPVQVYSNGNTSPYHDFFHRNKHQVLVVAMLGVIVFIILILILAFIYIKLFTKNQIVSKPINT